MVKCDEGIRRDVEKAGYSELSFGVVSLYYSKLIELYVEDLLNKGINNIEGIIHALKQNEYIPDVHYYIKFDGRRVLW